MIGGSLDSLAAYGKRLQTAHAEITRADPADEPVFDPETGTYTDPPPVEVYDGSCMIGQASDERVVDFGEGPTAVRTYTVTLDGPVDGVQVGDDVAISGSRDPALNGGPLVVLDVPKSEHVTNRQIVVEEVL